MHPTFTLIRLPGCESIRPATTSIIPPLGLAYIAAALEAEGCPLKVIDAVAEAPRRITRYLQGVLVGLTIEEIVARISSDTGFIGISALFTHEWPFVVRLIESIKKARPDIQVIVGGEHVSSLPEFSLITSQADYLVLGEGEKTIVELWHALREGRPTSSIAGIAYREGSQVMVSPRRERIREVDKIHPPAWHYFDLETYYRSGFSSGVKTGGLSVPILATRGCPYQCTYCSSPNMWTTKWFARSPERVVDEIKTLQEKYGATDFPLQDLTAILRKDWVVHFCKILLENKMRVSWQFPTGTRCEVIDDEVAGLMCETGMIAISFAPESGSEEIRRVIKKKMSTQGLRSSIDSSVRAGLSVTLFLVIGFPEDKPEQYLETLEFLREAARAGVENVSVGYYMALPGTELFSLLVEKNKIHLNRDYFRHIMHGLEFFPRLSFNEAFPRWRLFVWKFRLFGNFYFWRLRYSRRTARARGKADAISVEPKNLGKLGTAIINLFRNVKLVTQGWLAKRWLSREAEKAMLSRWDEAFKRSQLLAVKGKAPIDTRNGPPSPLRKQA